MTRKLPKEIEDALKEVSKKYTESEATTNAGRVLRFLARFISLDTLAKVVASKIK